MKSRVLIGGTLAAVVLALSATLSFAQTSKKAPLAKVEELSACFTLETIRDRVLRRIDSEKSWIKANRNNRSISRERFNKRVDANTARVQIYNQLNDDYYTRQLRQLCLPRQASAGRFLYDSPACVRWRRKNR